MSKQGKMTRNAKAFKAANATRGVVKGTANGPTRPDTGGRLMATFPAGYNPLDTMFGMLFGRRTVYTFVNSETQQPTHIDVDPLLTAIKRAGVVPMLCEMGDTLEAALERNDLGVEEEHALKLPVEALDVPILVCCWGDTHVVADGAHRLWRRWKRGDKGFPAYVIPERAWRPFVITGLPGDGAFWNDFNRNAKIRS